MKLTATLLSRLPRTFDKDPLRFVALRIGYAGALSWTVAEGVLTLTVVGGPGASVVYDLSNYTLDGLVAAIAARTGFAVSYVDPDRRSRSALCLLDGSADPSTPNGDALMGYTSLAWAFFEAFAVVLQRFRDQAGEAIRQLSTTTAEGVWLDELGSYYKVVRDPGEADAIYGQRIIAQTLRPVSNNVAIEMAIEKFTGQPCTVVDVTIFRGVFPIYDGTIHYDGAHNYDTVGFPEYGLFDVTVAYDLLLGGDPAAFTATVQALVEKLRAAGKFLRALALGSAATPIRDTARAPTDTLSSLTVSGALSDTMTGPAEAFSNLAIINSDTSDAFTAPTDSATGAILAALEDETGAAITDEAGDPILAQIAPLFV